MTNNFEAIHTVSKEAISRNPQWNMPYVPAIKVISGQPVYISGVNAAAIYHSHPHKIEEFDQLDFSLENQAKLTMNNLKVIIEQAGGSLTDIVQLFIFIVDVQENGDNVGRVMSEFFGEHLATSTVVGISGLITDPRLLVEITATAYV